MNASAFPLKQHEFSINDMNSTLFCVYSLNWPAALKVCTLNVHILSELSVLTILELRAGNPVNQNCQLPVKGTSSSPEEDQLTEFFHFGCTFRMINSTWTYLPNYSSSDN